jgi:hypothetical protein
MARAASSSAVATTVLSTTQALVAPVIHRKYVEAGPAAR